MSCFETETMKYKPQAVENVGFLMPAVEQTAVNKNKTRQNCLNRGR